MTPTDAGASVFADSPGITIPGQPHRDADVEDPAPGPGITRALVLVLVAIVLGLAGLYLVRAALVHVGGFTLGSASALPHLAELLLDWRFWAGGALIFTISLISLELYGSAELSKVVPLYSLSYVLIALIGQLFLGEDVTVQRWAGIVTIVAGVIVLLRS